MFSSNGMSNDNPSFFWIPVNGDAKTRRVSRCVSWFARLEVLCEGFTLPRTPQPSLPANAWWVSSSTYLLNYHFLNFRAGSEKVFSFTKKKNIWSVIFYSKTIITTETCFLLFKNKNSPRHKNDITIIVYSSLYD